MLKRIAKRIAQKYIEQNFTQPLRLQPDYNERNAQDFLGEGSEDLDDRMAEAYKESRFSKGEKGRKEFEKWKEEQGEDFQEEWEANTEKYKDVVKNKAKSSKKAIDDEIIDDMGLGRMAEDHDRGSYMSRQNLREMSDMADFIVDDIGMEGLDDWVEDKISQSYSAVSDVARYRGYRDDHSHGEESFKLAGKRRMTPFEIVTNWFSQAEEDSEGEIEYMMSVDDDDEISGDVEIFSGHDISSLIRDLERDLRWSDIEFSKSGRRTIRWGLPAQTGFEGEHFRFANNEISQSYSAMNDVARYRGYRDDYPHGHEDLEH